MSTPAAGTSSPAHCHEFRGTLGTKVLVLRPRDPEAKGIIERAHDYLERSFLPGRTFTGPADFNGQLQAWLEVVNQRRRRALGCAPVDRIAADTAGDAAAAAGGAGDWVADRRAGCRVTSTSAWTATTTRCTRR